MLPCCIKPRKTFHTISVPEPDTGTGKITLRHSRLENCMDNQNCKNQNQNQQNQNQNQNKNQQNQNKKQNQNTQKKQNQNEQKKQNEQYEN